MSWNYRVVLDQSGWTIREVYYTEDGRLYAWSLEGIAPFGQTPEELKLDMELLAEAFNKPALEIVDGKMVEARDAGDEG